MLIWPAEARITRAMPLIITTVCNTAASVRCARATWRRPRSISATWRAKTTAPKPYEVIGKSEQTQLSTSVTAGEETGPVAGLASKGELW